MSSAGPRPSAGARFVLEKSEESAGEVVYRGFAHLPDADLPAVARIELPGGAVTVSVGEGSPDLEKMAAALLRAATKADLAAGAALPRKIVRWRG